MLSPEDPLYRIQREISEVVEREQELKNANGHHISSELHLNHNDITPPRSLQNNVNSKTLDFVPTLQKAVSTSQLNVSLSSLSQTRKFAPNPGQKGIMHRFIKSRGRISDTAPTFSWQGEPVPAKVQSNSEKPLRRGYVPVEEKIQQELREMQNREAELRALRHKSFESEFSPDSNFADDSSESLFFNVKLRGARSLAQLTDSSDEYTNDSTSSPSSLRPAISLVHLCDGLDENSAPSSSRLIAQFESIIQQNREQL